MTSHPEPPQTSQLLKEFPTASLELLRLANKGWKSTLEQAPHGDGSPVMTIPGFGGGDGSMAFLRRYLDRIGYRSFGWEQGTNILTERVETLDGVLEFCSEKENAIVERLEKIYEMTHEKISLVGWSLGGVYANVLAQTHPELIRQVITLGSPVGDPRGTSIWNLMKRVHNGEIPDDMQNVTGWMVRRDQLGQRKVRTTILYSPYDGAVSEGSARIEDDPLVENVIVPSSHMGFAHNPVIYWIIAERLSQDPLLWREFNVNRLPKKVRKKFRSVPVR